MFDLSLTLNPSGSVTLGGTNADKVYDLVDFPSKGQSVRRNAVTALTTPETLTISHREFTEKGQPFHQHLVRLDQLYFSALGDPRPYATWFVMKAPGDNTTVSNTMMKDSLLRLCRFAVTTGYLDKVLNGEP